MGRQDTAARHENLLHELNEERAAALLRISRTLEGLIAQLQTQRERIVVAAAAERDVERERYRELHAQAVKYRWYLEVQREALGLRHHHRIDEFYAIPPSEAP